MGNLLTATQLVNSKALTQTHSNLLGPLRILPTGSQEGDQQVMKFPPRVSLSDRGTDTYTTHTNLPHTHTNTSHTHNTHIRTTHRHASCWSLYLSLSPFPSISPSQPSIFNQPTANGPYTLLKIYSYKLHCQPGLGLQAQRAHREGWPLPCSLRSHFCTQTQYYPRAKRAGSEGLKGPASWAGGGWA